MTAAKQNIFSDASKAIDKGVDALFNQESFSALIPLDEIIVREQVRKVFEDEENSLSDLAESLKTDGQIQPILLNDTPKGYVLVSGERRYRAAKLAGWTTIKAIVEKMTDEQAERRQFAENVQRLNLSQIEMAEKLQLDVQKHGVKEVAKTRNKNESWVSKVLQILKLDEQATRLIKENISADIEVINTVKQVEKVDPVKAKALVDNLKDNRGKIEARVVANAVKEEVKPSKAGKPGTPAKPGKPSKEASWPEPIKSAGTAATAKDRTQETPSKGETFAAAKVQEAIKGPNPFADSDSAPTPPRAPSATVSNHATANPPKAKELSELLTNSYFNVADGAVSPENEILALGLETAQAAREFLQTYFDAGKQAIRPASDVMRGLKNGQFSSDGHLAFALAAFLEGADRKAKFDLLNIFGLVKS